MKIITKLLMITSIILVITSCNELNNMDNTEENSNDTENALENVKFTRITASGSSITVTWTDPVNENFDHVDVTCSNGDTAEIEPGINTKTFAVSPEIEYEISFISKYNDGKTSDANHKVYVTTPKTGTKEYIPVYTASEFVDATSTSTGLKGNYILVKDIDFSTLSNKFWKPIGDLTTSFSGIFDGNNHKISELNISFSDTDGVGFFASTSSAIIRNVSIENANIVGKRQTGALIGYASDTKILNCSFSGVVSVPYSESGGLVGKADKITLSNCYSTGETLTSSGGLVGDATDFALTNCYSSGKYNGSGLIYNAKNGTITDCYSTGETYTGGLVYEATGVTLTNCYSTGKSYGGGLIYTAKSVTMSNCHSTGDIYNGGGLIKKATNVGLTNCYSTGNVNGYRNLGGLIGKGKDITLTNCYSTGNITGKIWENGDGECIGGLIGSVSDVSDSVLPVLNTWSSGEYGGTATISNCYSIGNISGKDHVGGLVGYAVNVKIEIMKCFSAGEIQAENHVGGLVGYYFIQAIALRKIENEISNCYSTGNISGKDYTGGLFGSFYICNQDITNYPEYIIITNCYSSGKISCSNNVGGIFGFRNMHDGTNFYFSQAVFAQDNVYWNISENSSLSDVGNIIDYEDNSVTNNIDVAGIYGLTNMKDRTNYNKWDLSTTWDIDGVTNNGYPFLRNMP